MPMEQEKIGAVQQLDKKLISLVKERPALYDPRYIEQDKIRETKQALWHEICTLLEGQLDANTAKARWKYLRESYMKAKHKTKIKEEVAKRFGTPLLQPKLRKHSFRYHELMEFLEDSIRYQSEKLAPIKELRKVPKVPNIIKRVVPIAPKPSVLQVNSADLQASMVANNIDNVAPFTLVHIPSTSSPQNSNRNDSSTNSNGDAAVTDYDKIFLECLQKPIEQPSPVDGFLIRLGEGLKKLPYRERSKLEIEFLQRLYEVEEQLDNCDEMSEEKIDLQL
ncbi:uncharacterized protein LOC106641356 [Copidosoma floridanum]|uniref:uncharacterized protein LOC106641356 n=1 Tax=Copidosoma floridanum TaxID=29053 RepID=UPI0006C969DC|nr:uncharacterized protein LOC106641356 [Copidosoma floridanum]